MDTSFILLLLVFSLIPSSLTQCTTVTALPYFRRSVYEFSIELVKRIAQDNENHFVSSALSPWTLISTLSLGATDETMDEIKQVLRLHPHACFNKKFFEIVQRLSNTNDGTVLERSSSIFADENLDILDKFKNKIHTSKVSSIHTLPFDDSAHVANIINDFVREATNGNIEDIIEPMALDNVQLVLIDALYFKGTWVNQFSPENTEESAFYDSQRVKQIGDVSLMYAEFGANLTNVRQIGATVLELPYGSKKYSMLFILPDDTQTITTVLDNLNHISLRTIFALFEITGEQRVSIQIPRFKMTSDLSNLKELLIDMGLRSMFDESASFFNVTELPVHVSDFIQKATIEVTEEGTEASAASAGFLEGRSLIETAAMFIANKPFLYMIVHRELQLPLFTGAYSKPEFPKGTETFHVEKIGSQ